MQTFLPVTSFVKSMEFLDLKRLGKQRVEAGQILEILENKPYLPQSLGTLVPFDRTFSHWRRHPAVQMWSGHEEWLKLYIACAIGEWCSRGYINSIVVPSYNTDSQEPPAWLGCEEFHYSHRCNLVRKFPQHYGQFWKDETIDISAPYYWPTLNGFINSLEEKNGIDGAAHSS